MNLGYHYTSLTNWLTIQLEGLQPYLILKPELNGCLPNDRGIWLWPQRLHGLSHVGSIIFQCATKGTTEVVLLGVQYDPADIPMHASNGDLLTLCGHNGTIGSLRYHQDERYTIVTAPIPPEHIRLIASYNLADAFAEAPYSLSCTSK